MSDPFDCETEGHEFCYELDAEPGEEPMTCMHCGAEGPDYPWAALDAMQ